MDIITGIAKEYKQTLIIVTHDPEIAVYANKIVTMKDGNIQKLEQNIGTGREIIYEKSK